MSSENATGLLDSWVSSVEYAILDWASIVIPPPVIITGAVGNPLAAGLLRRVPVSDLSAARYAVALLVVSTIRLFAEGAMEWFAYATSTKYIMHRADWICRLWKFLCLLQSVDQRHIQCDTIVTVLLLVVLGLWKFLCLLQSIDQSHTLYNAAVTVLWPIIRGLWKSFCLLQSIDLYAISYMTRLLLHYRLLFEISGSSC